MMLYGHHRKCYQFIFQTLSSLQQLDLYAGDHILGYQVSYEPAKKQRPWDGIIQNVTEVTALLVVGEENCTVTVRAFNTAGYGPAAHLSIDTQRQNSEWNNVSSMQIVFHGSDLVMCSGAPRRRKQSQAYCDCPTATRFLV